MRNGDATRSNARGAVRDLGYAAAAVAVAALLVIAVVTPASRLTPSLLPAPLTAAPAPARPQVAGVVVTKDTGGVIVRRGLATGPVGAALLELAVARPPAPEPPASTGKPTVGGKSLSPTATTSPQVASTTAEAASSPVAESTESPEPAVVRAASASSDRSHGRGNGRAEAASGRGNGRAEAAFGRGNDRAEARAPQARSYHGESRPAGPSRPPAHAPAHGRHQ